MWTLLAQQVGVAKLRRLTIGFFIAALLQGITFALMIPFLQQFLTSTVSPALVGLVIVMGIVTFLFNTWVTIRSYSISVYDICGTFLERLAAHVLSLPLGWFDARRQALIAAAMTKEVNTLSHVASIVIPGILNGLVVPAVMVVATLFVDWRLALIMLAAVLPMYGAWVMMRRRALHAHEVETRASVETAGRLIEFARLQPILRANRVVESGWAPLSSALDDESEATLGALRTKGRPASLFSGVIHLTFALVVGVGVWLVSLGILDPIACIAIATIAARVSQPLGQTILYASEAHNAEIALRSVKEIFDAQPLVDASGLVVVSDTTLTFTDVDFGYAADRNVVEGLSFEAPSGQITALIGPSGCGKTTVLRLAARFWDVDAGQVRIGGVDVRDIPMETLMSQISMVFQDVYLFDATIRENVLMAKPDATSEELHRAARLARLDHVIESLPDGWDTQVGQGGLKLSGGERQRVSIARAFLKDAPILLLDEITSALDGENESAITDVMRDLSVGRTVIVVAHRLSTISGADRVIAFDMDARGVGTIVEQGTPEELSGTGGLYARFVLQSQMAASWNL